MRLTDVHRSARRWVSYVLGDEWIVRLEQRHASEDDVGTNLAFVEVGGGLSTLFARSGGVLPQGDVRRQCLISVTCLPVPDETPQESSLHAVDIAESLQRAAEVGLVYAETGLPLAEPLAIPIWDFAGVPVLGPARGGPPVPVSRAEINDFTARPLPDPEDDRLYSISAVMRLTWWTRGADGQGGPPAVGGILPLSGP